MKSILPLVIAWLLCGWPLPVSAAQGRVAAPQPVALPYAVQVPGGGQWTIQVDGSLEIAGQHYHNGGQLQLENVGPFMSNAPQALLDAAHTELTLNGPALGGLQVSRRVRLNAAAGWCRYVEVLENPGAAPVQARLHVQMNPGGQLQQTRPIADDRRGAKTLGLAMFDGDDAAGIVVSGRGGKLSPQILPHPENGNIEIVFEVQVPPRQTVAVAHIQVFRSTIDEVSEAMRSSKDRDWMIDLPRPLASHVANFPAGDYVGDVEILRGGLLDVLELKSGDRYKGTLAEGSLKLQTAFGPVEISAERMLSILTAGLHRPEQLVVLSDGQILSGRIAADALPFELSSGQTIKVPLRDVGRVGMRKRAGEPEEIKSDKPMALLRDGGRFEIAPPRETLTVFTSQGPLQLPIEAVAAITFADEDHPLPLIELTDGSRISGAAARDVWELQPAGFSGTAAKLGAGALRKLQFSQNQSTEGDDPPRLILKNGDLLCGELTGKLALETAFDNVTLDAAEIRSLAPADVAAVGATASPADVQATLADEATVGGRLREEALEVTLRCGVKCRTPVAAIKSYENPTPRPAAAVVERITSLAAELTAADWKRRDRASAQLLDIGQIATPVLRSLRDQQPPEGKARIDELLARFEAMKRPPPPAPNLEFNKDDVPAARPVGPRG